MLRMLLCSGAMKIMRIVYHTHFRLIPSPLRKSWDSGLWRWKAKANAVPGCAIFFPFSHALFFSPSLFFMELLSRVQHHRIPVRKKLWEINIMSGAQNNSNNLLSLLWKQRILPIEFNLWQSKQGFLAK